MTMFVLVAVSVVRLAPLLGDYVAPAPQGEPLGGPPIYLLLLDGYPRIDSLEGLGIDNGPFVSELEARGFDHYPNATSAHQWTHRTLQAMVAGSPLGIPDEPGTNEDERALRASLQLPATFLAIDPPAGHVVMRGGTQASAGGMNDFEVRLLGTSLVGTLARSWAADVVAESLRAHFEGSLRLMVASTSPRTFTHVLAPHPPFLYAGGLSACWPGCDIFDVSADKLEMSVEEWGDRMGRQLAAVNDRVLSAIDLILEGHPDAVIVLFSDHGGRYDVDLEEVHHSFLAARTPGHPALFEAEPHPHAVLRLIGEAYP